MEGSRMTNLEAVRQAKYHFEHKANYTKQTRIDAVIELAEWLLFSNRQIASFTGMRSHEVAAYTGKTDRTGGNLAGESLGLVIDLIHTTHRGEVSYPLTAKAVAAGASTRMISRLTGLAQRTVARWALKGAA
jgi:hypothetical protein